ncbi:fibrous sheath CABYR-binding protein-like [Salvia splendens]|uniref:fibrous sheath CABYR-binding protein-like n=1 Tax=Salvia splendens TaxID=180675 RepID=UPI001C273388|nr:fibrous sheath CABYR-binding protein-like [Salvia splendens]
MVDEEVVSQPEEKGPTNAEQESEIPLEKQEVVRTVEAEPADEESQAGDKSIAAPLKDELSQQVPEEVSDEPQEKEKMHRFRLSHSIPPPSMDKSTASGQSQKPSSKLLVRKIPSTPPPETLTPPTPQSMVLPVTGMIQPKETSVGESYLKIITDMMGKFSPTRKVSDFLTNMAEEIKKEEARPNPLPLEVPTTSTMLARTPNIQTLEEPTHEASHPPLETLRLGIKKREALVPSQTLDVKAVRRSCRTQRRLDSEEPKILWEEAAILTAAKGEAAERKRKGKQVATPSKDRKLKQASLGVVIREFATVPTKTTHCTEEETEDERRGEQKTKASNDEENVGTYEMMEVELDQKLLEAMVYLKDPKLRKICAGRVMEARTAKSRRKIREDFLEYESGRIS